MKLKKGISNLKSQVDFFLAEIDDGVELKNKRVNKKGKVSYRLVRKRLKREWVEQVESEKGWSMLPHPEASKTGNDSLACRDMLKKEPGKVWEKSLKVNESERRVNKRFAIC